MLSRRSLWSVLLLSAVCAALGQPSAARAEAAGPAIAAAADLKFAMDEISANYRRDSGQDVRVTYGSSGNFERQIEQGAPFELFFSADESYVDQLAKAGLTRDAGTLYAVGRIVVFAPKGSALKPDGKLEGVRELLKAGKLERFAIANPEHAPYGRAAQEALQAVGLWDQIQPKLVLGENISQAAQFASTGNADGGIIAYSLALSPEMQSLGTFALIPDSLHKPLRQRMVLLKSADANAERFYAYVQSAPARAVLKRYGFTLPGE
jgi:molybdate transport system substrate-binding protein